MKQAIHNTSVLKCFKIWRVVLSMCWIYWGVRRILWMLFVAAGGQGTFTAGKEQLVQSFLQKPPLLYRDFCFPGSGRRHTLLGFIARHCTSWRNGSTHSGQVSKFSWLMKGSLDNGVQTLTPISSQLPPPDVWFQF